MHRDAPGSSSGALVALCLVQFVDVLGVTEMITAMPRILDALAEPASAASLLLTAYAMCFGGLLMLGSRVGDRFGHRRTLLAGIAGFAAGSLACAVAPSGTSLVIGRCVQGASAAMSVPSALRLLSAGVPDPARRRRAMAAWSATGAAAGAAGYLVGGGVTELAGWRAMFWLNLPLAALMAAAVLVRVERDRGRRGRPTRSAGRRAVHRGGDGRRARRRAAAALRRGGTRASGTRGRRAAGWRHWCGPSAARASRCS